MSRGHYRRAESGESLLVSSTSDELTSRVGSSNLASGWTLGEKELGDFPAEDDYPPRGKVPRRSSTKFFQFLDAHLTGRTDASQFSEAWRNKFSHHPSWCDADMCLQQINLGRAKGNRVALYARSLFQRLLYHLGEVVQKWPKSVIVVGMLVLTVCCFGLQGVHIETDLVKLWVEQGGRLDEEMSFLNRVKASYQTDPPPIQATSAEAIRQRRTANTPAQPIRAQVVRPTPSSPNPAQQSASAEVELPKDNGLNGGGFQVLIQTQETPGLNILTKEGLLRHVKVMEEVAQYTVDAFGETWALSDICFRPPAPPPPPKVPLVEVFTGVLERIIPCIWITPADCFWEGSKPLGPFPPIDLDLPPDLLKSLPKGNITWKNLDPEELLIEATSYLKGLEPLKNLFERAGIGHAYQKDRPCIDPLDAECPSTAPNYFDRCEALKQLAKWNSTLPVKEKIYLKAEKRKPRESSEEKFDIFQLLSGKKRKKRAGEPGSSATSARPTQLKKQSGTTAGGNPIDNDYYDDVDPSAKAPSSGGGDSAAASPAASDKKRDQEQCEIYGKSLLKWMAENPKKWSRFLDEHNAPIYPNWGQELNGGCQGFGKKIMQWPEDLIIGGIKKRGGVMESAEALQSVFLVASSNDVYRRFQRKFGTNVTSSKAVLRSADEAGHIIATWQRRFTDRIYNHPLNRRNGTERVLHPLASTSIQDMLAQFSEFQWGVIVIGYILMIIYAGWSQIDWDGWWFSEKSSCFLAILGVLVITYASVAGLGLATVMGIHFNAATTQIVPFLTLGLGIDDMFLILHNYNGVLESVKKRELAVLLKETGMSVLITSINNILAFLTGIILPIPALRSFCAQVAILLFFNVACTIVIFPAFIAIDLRRRKEGLRDMTMGCCCRLVPAVSAEKKRKLEEANKMSTTNMSSSESRNQLVGKDSRPSLPQLDTGISTVDASPLDVGEPAEWYTLTYFLHRYYIPLLQKPWAKVGVLFICAFMFLFGCLGLYRSKLGLELADVLPENTPPAAFLRARERYFSFYPMYLVLQGPNVDYPTQQQRIEQLRLEISKLKFVITGQDGKTPSEHYWMHYMQVWLESLQQSLDKAIADKLIDSKTGKKLTNKTLDFEVALGRRLLCSYGRHYNCSKRMDVRLVDEEGVINAEGFYNYLTAWYNIDNMMYYVSQASFFPTPPPWAFALEEDVLVPPAPVLLYSQMPIYLTGLVDTPPIIEMIEEVRAVCKRFTDDGLPNFPAGIPFTFWEQYLHLTFYLFIAILTIGIAVLFVISIIIFNPWAAAMVAIIVVSMTVELAGFMGLFGVKMNPISAVTLITAVGIGVEFTAHVVLAFLTSLGTRNERMASCLEHMFVPVIHGGLSTLLGIVMLAFSEFDFVIKYFFVVMTALIVIGLFNGLAMLPVMLSLIGPPCEIVPIDGGKILPCPPSRRKTKRGGGGDSPTSSSSSSSSGGRQAISEKEHKFHESLSTLNEENSYQSNPSLRPQPNAEDMKATTTPRKTATPVNSSASILN